MSQPLVQESPPASPRALRRILVPLDGSHLAEQAVAYAATLARASHASIEFVLVHIPFPFTREADVRAHTRKHEVAYLDHVVETMRTMVPGVDVHCMHMEEPVIPALRGRVRDFNADLILMTTHGRTGFHRAWLGSVSDALIRETNTPVLVVRSNRHPRLLGTVATPFRRLLLPLDGSATAEAAIGAASLIAQDPAATLVLMQVVTPVVKPVEAVPWPYPIPVHPPDAAATEHAVEDARHYLLQLRDVVCTRTGRVAEVAGAFVDASAASAIISAAERHSTDVIVMTTHGRGASRLLWGSVVDKVMRGTELPILIVRPGEGAADHATG